jgi:hypothetical protein
MLLFDFEKIWLISGGDSRRILKYFRKLYNKEPGYESLRGTNYIINPEVVARTPNCYTDRVLAEYLGVCALRNYATYQQFQETALDISYFPDYIPKEVVTKNPLLAIKQDKIIFKEENT